MTKLKLSELHDNKQVRATVELPAKLHRDLVIYAQLLGGETGSPIADPLRLIVPMLERFIATDRAFAKARRTKDGEERRLATAASFPSDSTSERI